jgi:hypothetical protein
MELALGAVVGTAIMCLYSAAHLRRRLSTCACCFRLVGMGRRVLKQRNSRVCPYEASAIPSSCVVFQVTETKVSWNNGLRGVGTFIAADGWMIAYKF